jgi:hypothetical protein
MKRAARKDANQAQLVGDLRSLGCSVYVLNGEGLPDLLVGTRGRNFLFEVKTETGTLTPAQEAFIRTWAGAVHIVRHLGDAREVIGI